MYVIKYFAPKVHKILQHCPWQATSGLKDQRFAAWPTSWQPPDASLHSFK